MYVIAILSFIGFGKIARTSSKSICPKPAKSTQKWKHMSLHIGSHVGSNKNFKKKRGRSLFIPFNRLKTDFESLTLYQGVIITIKVFRICPQKGHVSIIFWNVVMHK